LLWLYTKNSQKCRATLLLLLILLALKPHMGFGLLHQIIPGFPTVNKLDPISQFWLLYITYYFISRITMGFQSVIFLASFISSTLFRCPHHFILCALMYLTISSSFINFCNLLLLLILHPSLHWIGPNIFLKIYLSYPIYFLCPIHIRPRFHTHQSLLALSMSCRASS